MRLRFTVTDSASNLEHDVVVDCEATAEAGQVMAEVARTLGTAGPASVDGRAVQQTHPVGSALRTGAVLAFGRPAHPRWSGFSGADADELRLRVLSGPSAGVEIALPRDQPVSVGRAPDNRLVLVDQDVSGRHAELRATPSGVQLLDVGSRNGTWVDGQRTTGSVVVSERSRIQLGGSRIAVEAVAGGRAMLRDGDEGDLLLNRVARNRPAPFRPTAVQLPARPVDDDPRSFPILTAILPMVLAVVLALVLRNPLYLMMGLLSPVMLAGNFWQERRRRKRRDERVDARFRDQVRDARQQVEQAVDAEDFTLRARYPDPATVLRTGLTPRVELWARHPSDDDWLQLRLGTADRQASVAVNGELPEGWMPPTLRHAPVGVDLDQAGVIGLAGPPAWLDRRLEWVVAQLAVLHSPDELQLAVIAPEVPEASAGWLRWLPHTTTTSGAALLAWDDTGADELVRAIGDAVARQNDGGPPTARDTRGGMVVVLVGTGDLRRRPQLAALLARGPALGVRFVCAEHDPRSLPDGCRTQLVGDEHGTLLRADQADSITVEPDELPRGAAEHLARALAPLRRAGDAPEARVPDTVRLTDLIGRPDAARIAEHWRSGADATSVVIGSDAHGSAEVDIAAEGPHALVAGTSGAGKSELLQTWIAALAAANPPERLCFVFVDYKGGATFKDLRVPHVVGSVTNLDDRLARRAIASLDAELTRRQKQLAEYGAGDLSDYRRRAGADPRLPPFPRLVVVVDELAEMKQQLPQFVDELVRIARIGRSLGVHLVLATQRPAGVVDGQIRANVDLRICLRVADDSDSMDVIDRTDAARIPKQLPGRAYIAAGSEPARLVQTARITTTPRVDGAPTLLATPVRWNQTSVPTRTTRTSEGTVTDLTALVDAIERAAELDGRPAPYAVSMPELPAVVALDRLAPPPLHLTVGLHDLPARQLQEPLHLPLGTGHLIVAGSAKTGRTSALRSIAVGLASTSSPAELHLHAVDGAGGLAGLAALPHTGVVASDEDGERLERLLTRLVGEVRERRRLLAARGVAAIDELPAGPDRPAHIVLFVDSWAGAGDLSDAPAQVALQELLSSGLSAGVTVVVAGDERILRGRLLSRFTHRLCLRFNNPGDATTMGIDHRRVQAGMAPGRGLWVEDGGEVQVALLAVDPAGSAQAAALREHAAALTARYGRGGAHGPLRLDPLPVHIPLADAAALAAPPWASRTCCSASRATTSPRCGCRCAASGAGSRSPDRPGPAAAPPRPYSPPRPRAAARRSCSSPRADPPVPTSWRPRTSRRRSVSAAPNSSSSTTPTGSRSTTRPSPR